MKQRGEINKIINKQAKVNSLYWGEKSINETLQPLPR